MPIRASSLSNLNSSGIDREIGSQYDNVVTVADNIEAVNTVSSSIADVAALVENISSVNTAASLDQTKLYTVASIVDEIRSLYNDKATLDSLYNDKLILDSLFNDKGTLDSLYTDKAKLDSIYADKAKLDSLYADKATLDSLFNDKATLDSIVADKLALDSLYADKVKLDSLYADKSTLDRLYASIANIDTVATNISKVDTVANDTVAINEIYDNRAEIYAVDDLAAQVTQDKADITAMKLAVETIYDTFDDRFLGTFTADPTLDNDGNALLSGALYFNTSSVAMKVYDVGTTTWYQLPQVYLSALLDVALVSLSTNDLLMWNGTKWVNSKIINVDSIQLNGGTGTEGTLSWNDVYKTLDLQMNDNVVLQVGQELVVMYKNTSGSTILNGTPLMFTGAVGNSGVITCAPHDGTKASAHKMVGIATEDLANNGIGFSLLRGQLKGLDTTSWAEGAVLYIGAGVLTNVEPSPGNLKMLVAVVVNSSVNGTLQVRTNGIDEDVSADEVYYDNATSGLAATNVKDAVDELEVVKVNNSDIFGAIGRINSPLLDLDFSSGINMKAGKGGVTFSRASTATYIDRYGVLQYASIDEPRFEKDGLLIEGISTNVFTYSNEFITGWTLVELTLGATTLTAPDGSVLIGKLVESVNNTDHYTRKIVSSLTSSETYTASCFVKAGVGTSYVRLLCGTNGVTGFTGEYFNLIDGVTVNANSNANIIYIGDGWYRISYTYTLQAGATSSEIRLLLSKNGINTTYQGNGTDYVQAFGFQVENLPFATSYIPTTSASVTRNADVCTLRYKNNQPNVSSEQSVSYSVSLLGKQTSLYSGYQGIWGIQGDTYRYIRYSGGVNRIVNRLTGSNNSDYLFTLIPNEVFSAVHTSNTVYDKTYFNGVLVSQGNITKTIIEGNSDTNIIYIGSTGHTIAPLYGHIKNFKIYDKALTATEVALLG